MCVLLCVFSDGDHQGLVHGLLLSNISQPPVYFYSWAHVLVSSLVRLSVQIHIPVQSMLEYTCLYACVSTVVYLSICVWFYVCIHTCLCVCIHVYFGATKSDLQRWPGSSSASFPACCQVGETAPEQVWYS